MCQIGIYKITNLCNNKVYIGQTIDFESRKIKHIRALSDGIHVNRHLQSSWSKYGEKNFEFEFIEPCAKEKLTEREQYWIDYYGGINSTNTYNQRDAGDSGTFSNEIRAKISEKNMGHIVPKETRQKLSAASKGRHHTEATKRKISESSKGKSKPYLRGKHLSEETKKKISDKMRGRPSNTLGYKHTEEAKRKIGDANRGKLGRKWTEEQRQAHSIRLRGRVAHNKGKVNPDSHKVGQYTLTGKLLNIYPSTHVLTKTFGYNPGCISKCCNGHMKRAYGYIWKYLD